MSEVAVGAPLRVGAALIIPLVEQRKRSGSMASAWWAQAELAAVGVVVKTASGVQAFCVEGGEHDSAAVLAAFPELDELLA